MGEDHIGSGLAEEAGRAGPCDDGLYWISFFGHRAVSIQRPLEMPMTSSLTDLDKHVARSMLPLYR